MNYTTMRYLDSTLAPFLNLLIFPLAKLTMFFVKTKNIENNICIVKLLGFGSILNSQPLINAIKIKHPESELFFITFKENAVVCKMFKKIKSVYVLDNSNFMTLFVSMLKLPFWALANNVTVCIDMEFLSNYSLFISQLTMTQKKIGYYSGEFLRKLVLTDHVYYNPLKHIRRIFMTLAIPLGITENSNLKLQEEDLIMDEGVSVSLADRLDIDNLSNYVLINPNASALCYNRRWPDVYYTELCKKILSFRPDLKLVFIGSASECAYTQSLIDKIRNPENCINLCGRLSLNELACVLSKGIKLFITNDSGPFHFSMMFKTSSIVFFGPESGALYGPLPDEKWCKVFEKDLYCVPCLNVFTKKYSFCNNNECLKSISVNEVFEYAKYILQN